MLQIRKMGPQIGVEISGVDVKTMSDAEYHHVWRKGATVNWDNRCSYHKAAGDYPPEEARIHWRVSINDFGVEALYEAAE